MAKRRAERCLARLGRKMPSAHASAPIAGEAICGLLWAGVIQCRSQQAWLHVAAEWANKVKAAQVFEHPAYLGGIIVMALLPA
jgi:hypothetical protein